MTECNNCENEATWIVNTYDGELTKEEAMELQEEMGYPIHLHGFYWHENQPQPTWSCRIKPDEHSRDCI